MTIDGAISAAVRRPVSVIVATIALSALGAFSAAKLPVSLLPQIERPRMAIIARAPALSRDQMLHDVTEPLQQRLDLVPGLTSVTSRTTDGETRIEIESAWQTDADRLRIDVARRIEGATAARLEELAVETISDESAVIDLAVTGGNGASRTRLAKEVILPELARLEGAGRVEMIGARPLRLTVEPRAAALAALGLTAGDVEARLRSAGTAIAAGVARDGASTRPMTIVQPVESPSDLAALRVRDVPLGEVASIRLREIGDASAFRAGEGEGVLLRLHRAPRANAVALASAARQRIAELSRRAGDLRISVVRDRSREVSAALFELAASAILGVILGTLILRWMLGRWRPTLALAVVIPVALLVSFSVFFFAGISLNVISLAGLALATGLLVDNSIVVLESIESARASGKPDPVVDGTRQILLAVVASSVTLVVVFAPLLYMRGLARTIFGEQALAVVASVLASLFFSVTLTPVLAARDRRGDRGRIDRAPSDLRSPISDLQSPISEAKQRSPGLAAYVRLLDRAMERPVLVIGAAAAFLAVSIPFGFLLPRELFAGGAARDIVLKMHIPRTLDDAAARASGAKLWQSAREALRGTSPEAMSMVQEASGGAEIDVRLRDAKAAREAMHALRKMRQEPGVIASVEERPGLFVEAIGSGRGRLEIIPSARTEREATELGRRVAETLEKRGWTQIPDPHASGGTALVLRWDDRLLASNGADRSRMASEVRAALGHVDLGQSSVPGAEKSIRLLPTVPGTLSTLPVRLTPEKVVPLAAVGSARLAERSSVAWHDDGRPARPMAFDGNGEPATAVQGIELARGERIRIAGGAREWMDAAAQMRLAFVLAVLLLYLTVAAFYESLVLPLLVLTAVPFAAAGAVLALLVTGSSLDLMALIGIVFLAGIVVNHTVVLLDRCEQLRNEGVDEGSAIRTAARERYRPVVMTTATAILGMLPLAFIGGSGVELRRAIAVTVTGGLVVATVGTLVLIPLLHVLVEPLRRRSRAAMRPAAAGVRIA